MFVCSLDSGEGTREIVEMEVPADVQGPEQGAVNFTIKNWTRAYMWALLLINRQQKHNIRGMRRKEDFAHQWNMEQAAINFTSFLL